MERTPVSSSHIVSVGHDPVTSTLEVEFRGGGVYRYESVPAADHAALMAADSVGKHFHENVRNLYRGAKVEPPTGA